MNGALAAPTSGEKTMTLKIGILAAAAALTLAVPAIAFAQPYYGGDDGRGYYANRDFDRHEDFRRAEREREWRREQEWRRLRWEREHAYRYGFGYSPYYR
jgi:hypothetical protein